MNQKKNILLGFLFGALIMGGIELPVHAKQIAQIKNQYQQLSITRQAELIDSMRRSDLGNLMRNVLDKVDDELKDNPKRILSDETISRIAALCYSFKPYAYPKGDSLMVKKLSPERGQILLALSGMNLDSASLRKIMLNADFSDADLRAADFMGSDLSGVKLSGADLQDANLQGAILNKADMSNANLWGANLSQAKLNRTNFKRANLKWADLDGSDLKNANLNGADLTSAQMRNTDLIGSTMMWADVSGSLLNYTNLEYSDLTGTNFTMANLVDANLCDANLTRANLTETILIKADLTGTELHLVIVSEKNWLILLNGWRVTGAKEIQIKYKMTNDQSSEQFQYQLEKIEEQKTKK